MKCSVNHSAKSEARLRFEDVDENLVLSQVPCSYPPNIVEISSVVRLPSAVEVSISAEVRGSLQKTVDNALGVDKFCLYFYSMYYCSMYSAMHKKRYKFYILDFYAEN